MQPITKDNCDFPTLRQNGCVYVDKTAWLHRRRAASGNGVLDDHALVKFDVVVEKAMR